MVKRYQRLWIILLLTVCFIASDTRFLSAADELMLNGVVKNIDVVSSTAVIDVKSGSCPGQKTFKVDRMHNLGNLVGKQIRFKINSSSCRGDNMYTITQFHKSGAK
jgi:hypothetical protein